jgi:hypothetical protein
MNIALLSKLSSRCGESGNMDGLVASGLGIAVGSRR